MVPALMRKVINMSKFIFKNGETSMGMGLIAAELEKMTGCKDDKFYDHVISRLAAMENIGQLEGFSVGSKFVTVIKIS